VLALASPSSLRYCSPILFTWLLKVHRDSPLSLLFSQDWEFPELPRCEWDFTLYQQVEIFTNRHRVHNTTNWSFLIILIS
jgi:hypothetical protein